MHEALGKNVIHEDDVGLPTVNGYAYYFYRTSGHAADDGPDTGRDGGTGSRQSTYGGHRLAGILPPPLRADRRGLVGEAGRGPVGRGTAGGRAGPCWMLAPCTTRRCSPSFPFAATSEISFRAYYNKAVRRTEDPPAVTFLLGYDSEPIRAEKSLYDLAAWARGVPGLAAALLGAPATVLADVAAHRVPSSRGGPCTVAAVAAAVPGPPRPVRPYGLQPRLHPFGAGRRSYPAAGNGEVLPAGTGPRPARTAENVGRPQGGPHQPHRRPARAEPQGSRVLPAAAVGAGRRPDPRGRPGRRRPGLAADPPDAAGARTTAGGRGSDCRARRRVLAAPSGTGQRRRLRPGRATDPGSPGKPGNPSVPEQPGARQR